ncbi:hypothetical protein EP331_05565, partial [bacterium]
VKYVLFDGNERSSQAFLQQISGLTIPGLISRNQAERAKIRLERSRFFSEVSSPQYVRVDSGIGIKYIVREQNPNRFDLILGYVPKLTGGGDIVGNVELDLMNIISEGNQIALNYSRLEALKTRIDVELNQKYIAGLPISAGIQFDLYQRDSTFQTKNWRINSTYELSPYSSIGVTGRSESTGTGVSNSQQISNGNALFYGFVYELDFRNDVYVPTRGLYSKIAAEFGKKENTLDSDTSMYPKRETKQWFTLESEWYNTFKGRHTFLLSGYGSILLSDFYQDSDLFRFGGSKTFRGYNEEQFGASKVLWANLEYRFLLDRSSFLFAFHTRGWTESPTLKTEAGVIAGYSKFLQSFGLGLAYKTRLGLLSFTYAKSPEDTFDNAKIHFSVKGSL